MIFPLKQRKLIRGAAEHVKAGLSVAADYVAAIGTPLYSPFYGEIYHFEEAKGGHWIGIKRDDGLRFEFAHLSSYLAPEGAQVTPGQRIAFTGNTGVESTGPHSHAQILDAQGNRLDPEAFYTPTNIPVIAINGSIAFMHQVQAKILEYSADMCTISWDLPEFGLPKDPDQAQAYASLETFLNSFPHQYSPNRYFLLFVEGTNAFNRTYYDPQFNCTITVIPSNGHDAHNVAFELSHAFTQFYNENRGPLAAIEDVDSNFPSENFTIDKFYRVLPYTDVLLKK